jgi:hypothetical protein
VPEQLLHRAECLASLQLVSATTWPEAQRGGATVNASSSLGPFFAAPAQRAPLSLPGPLQPPPSLTPPPGLPLLHRPPVHLPPPVQLTGPSLQPASGSRTKALQTSATVSG